jgi:hypothetical protein
MNEPCLAASIDKAAKQKAVEIQRRIEASLDAALKNAYRPKDTGEEWIGEEVKAIVTWYASRIDTSNKPSMPEPTKKLLDACRAHIINSLIKGLPQIKELIALSEQEPNNE